MRTTENDGFTDAVARALRIAQMDAGMTRKEVSEESGVPARTLKRYLDAERPIEIPILRNLCNAIGVNMGSFLDAVEDSLGQD